MKNLLLLSVGLSVLQLHAAATGETKSLRQTLGIGITRENAVTRNIVEEHDGGFRKYAQVVIQGVPIETAQKLAREIILKENPIDKNPTSSDLEDIYHSTLSNEDLMTHCYSKAPKPLMSLYSNSECQEPINGRVFPLAEGAELFVIQVPAINSRCTKSECTNPECIKIETYLKRGNIQELIKRRAYRYLAADLANTFADMKATLSFYAEQGIAQGQSSGSSSSSSTSSPDFNVSGLTE